MLFLLSPAKSLDYQRPLPRGAWRRASEPQFVPEAATLVDLLKGLTVHQVARAMELSDELATLNVARYAAWQPGHDRGNSRPAVLAFDGDVYDGLDALSLRAPDLTWAQDHLVILSGLYGVLRPLDWLQPYRLEMGTALANARGKDLYAYWADLVTGHLNYRLAGVRQPVVVNLASQEYFRVVRRPALAARVVDCVFEDWHAATGPGQYKVIGFFAKRARGMMARFAVQQRVRSVKALQGFDGGGYAYAPSVSSADRLVFRRRHGD